METKRKATISASSNRENNLCALESSISEVTLKMQTDTLCEAADADLTRTGFIISRRFLHASVKQIIYNVLMPGSLSINK